MGGEGGKRAEISIFEPQRLENRKSKLCPPLPPPPPKKSSNTVKYKKKKFENMLYTRFSSL